MKSLPCKVLFYFFSIVLSIGDLFAQDSARKEYSFFNQTELGVFIFHDHTEYRSGSQTASNSGTGLSLQMVNGVLVRRQYVVGLGIAVLYSYQKASVLFLHVQYQGRIKGIIPFLFGDVGSSLGGNDGSASYTSGPMLAVGGGIQTKSRFHFVMSIGYLYVEESYFPSCHFCDGQHITDQGATIRIGFGF